MNTYATVELARESEGGRKRERDRSTSRGAKNTSFRVSALGEEGCVDNVRLNSRCVRTFGCLCVWIFNDRSAFQRNNLIGIGFSYRVSGSFHPSACTRFPPNSSSFPPPPNPRLVFGSPLRSVLRTYVALLFLLSTLSPPRCRRSSRSSSHLRALLDSSRFLPVIV